MLLNRYLWLSVAFGFLTFLSLLLTILVIIELFDPSFNYAFITIVTVPLLTTFSIVNLNATLKKDVGKLKSTLKTFYYSNIVVLSFLVLTFFVLMLPFGLG